MNDYCPEKWRKILHHNNLDTFEKLWDHKVEWFEEPNVRRGGWSGVCRFDLNLPGGGTVGIFRKTQENHITRTIFHPIGILTFVREMQVLIRFKKAKIPALEPVFFAKRKVDGNRRAILCSAALDDYTPLEFVVARWMKEGWPNRATRVKVMTAVAEVMNRMHDHKIEHNCFYPKHIFVRFDGDEVSIRLIDLEKAKSRFLRSKATFRDLYTLNGHSRVWSRTDRLRYLLIYLDKDCLDDDSKRLARKIIKRTIARGRSHTPAEVHK